MKQWLIIPRDPLIFRDGRPFSAMPGSRAKSLPMGFPSTFAGAARTQVGQNLYAGVFNEDTVSALLKLQIFSPILVKLDWQDQIIDFLFPAPSDAALFSSQCPDQAVRYNLIPMDTVKTDLADLRLCGLAENVKAKPLARPPAYWSWDALKVWLEQNISKDTIQISSFGEQGPISEYRMHVRMDPLTRAGEDGGLFQTSGLEFVSTSWDPNHGNSLSNTKRLGILQLADGPLSAGTLKLGGESRFVRQMECTDPVPFLQCPDPIRTSIMKTGFCRILLITPGYFANGNLPEWIKSEFNVEILAETHRRYEGVSGWDYKLHAPKPTRRLAPSGTVLFVKLPEDPGAREKFVDGTWMKPVSDDEQSRRDGFGLALLGIWDGVTR